MRGRIYSRLQRGVGKRNYDFSPVADGVLETREWFQEIALGYGEAEQFS